MAEENKSEPLEQEPVTDTSPAGPQSSADAPTDGHKAPPPDQAPALSDDMPVPPDSVPAPEPQPEQETVSPAIEPEAETPEETPPAEKESEIPAEPQSPEEESPAAAQETDAPAVTQSPDTPGESSAAAPEEESPAAEEKADMSAVTQSPQSLDDMLDSFNSDSPTPEESPAATPASQSQPPAAPETPEETPPAEEESEIPAEPQSPEEEPPAAAQETGAPAVSQSPDTPGESSAAAPEEESPAAEEKADMPAVTQSPDGQSSDPLAGFSLEGLIDEPAPEAAAEEQPAPDEDEDDNTRLRPDEEALKNEIESLGRILEESLELQEEIAQEKSLKNDPIKRNRHNLAKLLIGLRWLMAGFGMLGLIYKFSLALFFVSGYIAVLNLLFIYQFENPRIQLLSFPVTFAADLINITILIHLTGEINSILFLFYFLLAGAITLYSPLLRALPCTFICALVYVLYIAGGSYEGINAFGISIMRSLGIILSSAWVLMLKYLAGYAKEHLLPEAAQKVQDFWNKKVPLGAQPPQAAPQQPAPQDQTQAPAQATKDRPAE